MKKNSLFTLVELLIVIGIIIILAGILLPVTSSALKKADQTKALAQAKTLENAIKMFKNDYGYYPPVDTMDTLIKILQGEEAGTKDTWKNTKKTRYLEIQGNVVGEYKDPWGNDFKILVDDDYDGKITIASGLKNVRQKKTDAEDVKTLYYPVIVYSEGLDTNAAKTIDNVYSFPTTVNKKLGLHIISK